jgi:hypothetical protein
MELRVLRPYAIGGHRGCFGDALTCWLLEQFADEGKEVEEHVDAKNSSDG